MSNDSTGMPWGGIAKRTVQVAVVIFVGLTCAVAAGRRHERNEQAESERFRWTDANRWE